MKIKFITTSLALSGILSFVNAVPVPYPDLKEREATPEDEIIYDHRPAPKTSNSGKKLAPHWPKNPNKNGNVVPSPSVSTRGRSTHFAVTADPSDTLQHSKRVIPDPEIVDDDGVDNEDSADVADNVDDEDTALSDLDKRAKKLVPHWPKNPSTDYNVVPLPSVFHSLRTIYHTTIADELQHNKRDDHPDPNEEIVYDHRPTPPPPPAPVKPSDPYYRYVLHPSKEASPFPYLRQHMTIADDSTGSQTRRNPQ